VREMPEQYFWAHKRFKTRPPGEPNPYRKIRPRPEPAPGSDGGPG
jgi:KDO2-lipid IV(A) lauroyltransferase